MIAHTILTNTVFFFPLSELHSAGLHPHTVTQEDALSLIRASCLPQEDLSQCLDIQVFSTEDGVLLFLRPFPETSTSSAFFSLPFS